MPLREVPLQDVSLQEVPLQEVLLQEVPSQEVPLRAEPAGELVPFFESGSSTSMVAPTLAPNAAFIATDDIPGPFSATIRELRRAGRAATLELALRVGHIVTSDLCEGDPSGWRTRRREGSVAALARDPQLPFSRSLLYQCLRVYELADEAGGPSAVAGLSVSHFREVFRLDRTVAASLLRQAATSHWSVLGLRVAALKARRRKKGQAAPLTDEDALAAATAKRTPLSAGARLIREVGALRRRVRDGGGAFAIYRHPESLDLSEGVALQTASALGDVIRELEALRGILNEVGADAELQGRLRGLGRGAADEDGDGAGESAVGEGEDEAEDQAWDEDGEAS